MRRTRFDDAHCPIARVTDLFGDWWTPIILRDALFGVCRFDDFQKNLGVSRAVLSARLSRLVDEGLMAKVEYQQNPVRYEYQLTDKGEAATDVLLAMWRFGEDHLWAEGEEPQVEIAFSDSRERIRPMVVDESTGRKVELADLRMQRRRP